MTDLEPPHPWMAACAICSGELALGYPGSRLTLDSTLLSPTNHRPGEHPDLYRCTGCGTLQQASVPARLELARLYRGMSDDAYLAEEVGRRKTAGRVLELIARHAPGGRLLDVGCGHGLLLDEARRRGYAVEGLELSESAAAHARGTLGLTVHEIPLEDFDVSGERFDVVVLADVIEHLADPVSAVRHCQTLLRPGGVLCVITPDPASRVARAAGSRWWGLLPAHTFLFPRATLCALLRDQGFEPVEDAGLVRSFSAGYWLAGLAERGGRVGSILRGVRGAVPARLMLSVPLGDERVVVARSVSARLETAATRGDGSGGAEDSDGIVLHDDRYADAKQHDSRRAPTRPA
jgi:SAM-dependent methyltransferase